MLKITYTNRFKKDIKRIQKRGLENQKLQDIVGLLCEKKELPKNCRPHMLSGQYSGFFECHIEPDWLLIYRLTNEALELSRTGTHSDLF